MKRIEKGFYTGKIDNKVYFIIYNDDLQDELKWSIHFADNEFGEKVFAEEDQLWFTKTEAMQMVNLFVKRYS